MSHNNYVSVVPFEIFNVEKYRDLEIPVKGQSLKVVPFDRLDMVPLVFYSNFVPKTHCFFLDIRLVGLIIQ